MNLDRLIPMTFLRASTLVINFGDYRLGKRGISRVILAGADASVDF